MAAFNVITEAVLFRKVMMGLLSRGSVQSYFYPFERLGINGHVRFFTFGVVPPSEATPFGSKLYAELS
jgi:hypothetical protein